MVSMAQETCSTAGHSRLERMEVFVNREKWAVSPENLSSRFLTRSDTNRSGDGVRLEILEEEGLYYLCCENKDTDQLHGYRAADLHLSFRILCKKPGFLMKQLK